MVLQAVGFNHSGPGGNGSLETRMASRRELPIATQTQRGVPSICKRLGLFLQACITRVQARLGGVETDVGAPFLASPRSAPPGSTSLLRREGSGTVGFLVNVPSPILRLRRRIGHSPKVSRTRITIFGVRLLAYWPP